MTQNLDVSRCAVCGAPAVASVAGKFTEPGAPDVWLPPMRFCRMHLDLLGGKYVRITQVDEDLSASRFNDEDD